MKKNRVLTTCPVCGSETVITEIRCPDCDVTIRGHFSQGAISSLDADQMKFVRVFLRAQGNIKEVERLLGISYPTVKSRLEKVNEALGNKPLPRKGQEDRISILEKLEHGELSISEALKELGGDK